MRSMCTGPTIGMLEQLVGVWGTKALGSLPAVACYRANSSLLGNEERGVENGETEVRGEFGCPPPSLSPPPSTS